MRGRGIVHGGTTTSVYFFEKGERLIKHRHNVPHTTTVIAGATVVEIFDGSSAPIYMTPETDTLLLPADVDHEIMAVHNGTIMIAVIEGAYVGNNDPNMRRPVDVAGVLMADGTVQ